jgi:hypothetical protein
MSLIDKRRIMLWIYVLYISLTREATLVRGQNKGNTKQRVDPALSRSLLRDLLRGALIVTICNCIPALIMSAWRVGVTFLTTAPASTFPGFIISVFRRGDPMHRPSPVPAPASSFLAVLYLRVTRAAPAFALPCVIISVFRAAMTGVSFHITAPAPASSFLAVLHLRVARTTAPAFAFIGFIISVFRAAPHVTVTIACAAVPCVTVRLPVNIPCAAVPCVTVRLPVTIPCAVAVPCLTYRFPVTIPCAAANPFLRVTTCVLPSQPEWKKRRFMRVFLSGSL